MTVDRQPRLQPLQTALDIPAGHMFCSVWGERERPKMPHLVSTGRSLNIARTVPDFCGHLILTRNQSGGWPTFFASHSIADLEARHPIDATLAHMLKNGVKLFDEWLPQKDG